MNEKTAASRVASSGLIYLISHGDLVKIGHTMEWPCKRLKSLRAASPVPLALDAVMPGSVADEKALHELHRRSRDHGEWFRYSTALTALRDRMLNTYGLLHPTFGVPDFLFRLALADVEDEDEARAAEARRKRGVDRGAVERRIASYERRGREVPVALRRTIAAADYSDDHLFPAPAGTRAA